LIYGIWPVIVDRRLSRISFRKGEQSPDPARDFKTHRLQMELYKMEKKKIAVLCALMMFLMVSVFCLMYQKSGKLPVKALGLIAATCLPPVGMLVFTGRKRRR
jgi:hypothetical protein